MRRGSIFLLALVMACWAWGEDWAKTYKLIDESTIIGEVSGFDDNGAVFRLASGGFSSRVSWMKFTQDTLKLLAENPKVRSYVEPFIELPPQPRPQPKPIHLRDVPRVDRPAGHYTFFSSFTAPVGLVTLAILYFANLFSAYEIALYRNRPAALVCGVSAFLPLAGPLVFLASPSLEVVGEAVAEAPVEAAPEAPGPAVAPAGSRSGATSRRVGTPPPPAGGGLRVAAEAKSGADDKLTPKVFNRAEYTFNRRFIETQFSGFFRVVPSEAERDLVLVFKTAKQQYVGRRISRITSNELFLQLNQAGGTKETNIQFAEISQIIVRHKDHPENQV